jgi:hypothetical protein
MHLNYFHERRLSPKATELVQFDVDSILQFASSQHLTPPEIWLVDPDQYEKDGRVLRDSTSSRLIAYSSKGNVVYATDGCNSCMRQAGSPRDLRSLAGNTDIPPEMLDRLASLIHQGKT